MAQCKMEAAQQIGVQLPRARRRNTLKRPDLASAAAGLPRPVGPLHVWKVSGALLERGERMPWTGEPLPPSAA